DFNEEALKAQAVAARTYIIQHINQQDDPQTIITDLTKHKVNKNETKVQEQRSKDMEEKMNKIKSAVLATEVEVITYNDEPITPTFFSMSNGYTEDAEAYWGNELPYLKSVESQWEMELPNFQEQVIFSYNELSEKLNIPIQV